MKHEPPRCVPEIEVSRETLTRLTTYRELLQSWAGTLNLVSRNDLPRLWQRHVADSLQLLAFVPSSGALVDLGSGAGFPGLVLAIASGRPFHLVEADQRKAAFLREAARTTGAAVQVHAARIENVRLPPARLVTARAVAPLPQLLAWAAPLLEQGGACAFLKGRHAAAELTLAVPDWHMSVTSWQSRTDPGGRILHISEVSRRARS